MVCVIPMVVAWAKVDNKSLNHVVLKIQTQVLNIEPSKKVNTGSSILTLEDGVRSIN